MALGKVRALHPDFFSDDDLAEVTIPARLLFAGLWCFACDNGHVPDKSKQIKRWIYATDDVNVAELLRELGSQGLIERGGGWLCIPKLGSRQRIDWRYFKTCGYIGCEKPAKAESKNPEPKTRRGHASTLRESEPGAPKPVGDGVGEGDGDGDITTTSLVPLAENAQTARPASAADAAKAKRATQRPTDFRPAQSHVDLAAELGIDLRAEWQQFCDHHDAKGTTYKDWPAALRTWIRNAAKFGRGGRPAGRSRVDEHLELAERLRGQQLEIGEAG